MSMSPLRIVYVTINSIFLCLSLALVAILLRQRKIQQQYTSNNNRGWALMEIFASGAALLYTMTLFEYQEPPTAAGCSLTVWCRQLGFAAFYGAIVLKISRNLTECRVRKAHHVYVKETDLLKYLAFILMITFTGLLAYTVGKGQFGGGGGGGVTAPNSNNNNNTAGIARERSTPVTAWIQWVEISPSQQYTVCNIHKWSIVWQIYELLFNLYAIRLCFKARNTVWIEKYQFTLAVCFEVGITLTANILRIALYDKTSLEFNVTVTFLQIHLTVTVNSLLILGPKFYFQDRNRLMAATGSSGRGGHPSLAKLRENLINGTLDFTEVPVSEMNPEDIRAELKRVYTQLRMYKLKSIYDDNPHIISKRKAKKESNKDPRGTLTGAGGSGGQRSHTRRLSHAAITGNPASSSSPYSSRNRGDVGRKIEDEESSATLVLDPLTPRPSTIAPLTTTQAAVNSPLLASQPSSGAVNPLSTTTASATNGQTSATSTTDATVESSPHNVYLSSTSVAAQQKVSLTKQSVRV